MTPEEVVRGFQEATASHEPGFAVAEQYLTAARPRRWDPGAGVLVYDDLAASSSRTKDDVVSAAGHAVRHDRRRGPVLRRGARARR